MEHIIAEFYRNYYYPVILLDNSLKVAYKNAAAQSAKMKPRTGVHIKKYLNEENLKILRDISGGKTDRQVIELKEYPNRCFARFADDIIVLIFFDSMNYIRDYGAETAEQINKILAEYGKQELLCVDERDNKKMQKIRAYFHRHIGNIDSRKMNSEKSYCDIWEFLNNFAKGVSPFINGLGYKITFDIDQADKLFIYKLNESDFLTLNFILLCHALSIAVFGNLHIKFEPDTGVIIYEFLPASDFKDSGNIDLELAALIAKNNDLKFEFRMVETNMNNVEQKTQIWLQFVPLDKLSQNVLGINILNSDDIAFRAGIELAFLRANLK